MKIEELVGLYQKWGCSIKKRGKIYFYTNKMRNYSFPLFKVITIDDKLFRSFKWKYLMSTVLINSPKKNECEFILNTDNYDIQNLKSLARNGIKKSLQVCTFKKPSLDDLFHFGLLINRQTVKRQSREDKILTDAKRWRENIESIYMNNEFRILGAYYNNRMVGYTVIYELEGRYNLLYAYIDRQDSKIANPMSGLLYTQINQLIEEKGEITISYGLGGFAFLPQLIRFKLNMQFKQIPLSRGYIIHPLLLFIFKIIIFYNIRLLKRKNVKNPITQTIIRLYQGSRLLDAAWRNK
jgi:hypothetical protein